MPLIAGRRPSVVTGAIVSRIDDVRAVHARTGREDLLGADVRGRPPLRLHVRRAPADALADLAVGERQNLLLWLDRIFVRQVVRGEQYGERIVDEVQLLQRKDRLALTVEVEAVRVGDAVNRRARLGDDLGIDEGPELLAEEIGKVGDEPSRGVEFGDRDEDRGRVEGLARDAGEIERVEACRPSSSACRSCRNTAARSACSGRLGRSARLPALVGTNVSISSPDVTPRPAHGAQGLNVGHRADEIDEVVVGDKLKLLAGRLSLAVEVHEVPGVEARIGSMLATEISVVLAWPTT